MTDSKRLEYCSASCFEGSRFSGTGLNLASDAGLSSEQAAKVNNTQRVKVHLKKRLRMVKC
jgi:hypothetical protein